MRAFTANGNEFSRPGSNRTTKEGSDDDSV
jgi:hypothetical protein